jgi:hypothetical protein
MRIAAGFSPFSPPLIRYAFIFSQRFRLMCFFAFYAHQIIIDAIADAILPLRFHAHADAPAASRQVTPLHAFSLPA